MQDKQTEISRGISFEITSQLDRDAAQRIAKWIGCFGIVWNCKVAENKAAYRAFQKAREVDSSLSPPEADQKVAHLVTEERRWLGEVPSQIRRNAAAKWREALQAALCGFKAFPTCRNAKDKKNCCVTKELFEVVETRTELRIGLKDRPSRAPFCWICVKRKDELGIPNSLWLRRQGSRFWISWSYKVKRDLMPAADIVADVGALCEVGQDAAVVGVDVGIKNPVATSTGETFGFSADETRALRRHEKKIRRLCKTTARKRCAAKRGRRKCGSNYRKTKQRLSDRHARKARIRRNAGHRISKRLADNLQTRIIVAEKLNIKSMVRRPKARRSAETGKWERNGARGKAGLNRSILNVGWGGLLNKLEYKLEERNKLLVRIDPKYSSQECEKCGHIAAENRKTQAEFICVACGYAVNADINAARVLRQRFLMQLRAGTFAPKAKTARKIAPRRYQASQEADRVAVSPHQSSVRPACGANIRPLVRRGRGYEAGSLRGDPRQAGACSGSSAL